MKTLWKIRLVGVWVFGVSLFPAGAAPAVGAAPCHCKCEFGDRNGGRAYFCGVYGSNGSKRESLQYNGGAPAIYYTGGGSGVNDEDITESEKDEVLGECEEALENFDSKSCPK